VPIDRVRNGMSPPSISIKIHARATAAGTTEPYARAGVRTQRQPTPAAVTRQRSGRQRKSTRPGMRIAAVAAGATAMRLPR
jgi:hypothetical protein